MNDHLSGKEFTVRAFRKLLSIYVFSYFPFGFKGRIWDLILSVPDHCLSFYFSFDLQYIVACTILKETNAYMHFHKTFIVFWVYFWHIFLIQQSRNVSKNYCLLDVEMLL